MKTSRVCTDRIGRFARWAASPLAALALAGLAFSLGVGSAAAHVGVTPAEARPATNETFSVRVPTEKDEATVKVRVEFPTGLVVSRFQPKPGWQREIERDSAGRITAVVWSGGRVEPGEYDDFPFIARTPQEVAPLSFKAYQTYAGGETVEWVNAAGGERPAAVVQIKTTTTGATSAVPSIETPGQAAPPAGAAATAPAATSGLAATAVAPTGAAASGAVEPASGSSGSDLPLFAALAAVALALVATALAGVALSRRPQTT
jgi:uncharacterized protein YcnI